MNGTTYRMQFRFRAVWRSRRHARHVTTSLAGGAVVCNSLRPAVALAGTDGAVESVFGEEPH